MKIPVCAVFEHSVKVMEEIPSDPSRLANQQMTGRCLLDRAMKIHQSRHPRSLKNFKKKISYIYLLFFLNSDFLRLPFTI